MSFKMNEKGVCSKLGHTSGEINAVTEGDDMLDLNDILMHGN